jgi:hypothetical protein
MMSRLRFQVQCGAGFEACARIKSKELNREGRKGTQRKARRNRAFVKQSFLGDLGG